jgi:helix-turn-helix protein
VDQVSKRAWTVAQVRELGMATDIETAASVLGIGRTTAYTLARSGDFPAPVIRIGRRYVVSVEGLLATLGATGPIQAIGDGVPSHG